MNPYLLIYVWSKIRNIFQYLTLSETFNSVVHQALGSDGSRSELLLHRFTLRHIRHDSGHNSLQNFLSYSSFLIHFAGIRLIILWDKIDLTLWENYPLISQHSQWQLLQKKQGGKVRPSDIFTFKSFFDGVAVVFKKRENGLRWMPKTLFYLLCQPYKWTGIMAKGVFKLSLQGCCHDDHCDLPSLPVHLGSQVSTCYHVIVSRSAESGSWESTTTLFEPNTTGLKLQKTRPIQSPGWVSSTPSLIFHR